jgi:hypothetical protein
LKILGAIRTDLGIDLWSVGEGVLLVSWLGVWTVVFHYDTLPKRVQWDRESVADEALFGID